MGIFISLVGFQSMAVTSPLNTLIARGIITKPVDAYLLHTTRSFDGAKRIQTYLQNLHSDLTVHLREVSNSLQDPKAPQIVLREILEGYKKEKFYFNLAGAMNYQISACILSLEPEGVVYVYPESGGIRLFEIDKAGKIKMSEYETLIETNFEVYFRLQGLKIKTLPDKVKNHSAQKILALLIDRSLADTDSIIYSKAVAIGNVKFHYVFNSQNELIFVRNLDSNATKESVRKIINLATNRHDFGELLHHKIVVITSSAMHKERLQSEAGGKVTVIDPNIAATTKHSLKQTQYETERFLTKKETDSPKSLYLALGREIMPTLIALWSHKPKRACIIHTPQEETVQRYKKAMIDNKELLPCKEIVFIPTDITGKEILNFKPQADEQIECNITPGTKAQCAFLTRFAKMHSGTVWSINQGGNGSIDQIPEGKSKELTLPDIKAIISLKGLISDEILGDKVIDDATYCVLQKFIEKCKNKNYFYRFPNKDIKDKNLHYDSTCGLLQMKSTKIHIKLNMNLWFEELTAWSLKNVGAENIVLNCKRQITNEIGTGFMVMSEIDVMAIYQGKYLIISCKSGKNPSIYQNNIGTSTPESYYASQLEQLKVEAISDLKGTVSILGRFAIPLLSFFRHKGEPKIIDGVYVYGVDTLCDTEKMCKLLNDAIKARRTTAEEV